MVKLKNRAVKKGIIVALLIVLVATLTGITVPIRVSITEGGHLSFGFDIALAVNNPPTSQFTKRTYSPDEVTYYFNTYAEGVEEWTTTPEYAVDNVLTNFASTTVNNQVELLTGNTCPGTDWGTISKVEVRAYAYGDGDDELYIRPEFVGGTGDNHITVPVVSPGDWTDYQDITEDTNSPGKPFLEQTTGTTYTDVYGATWRGQTFTIGASAETIGRIEIYGFRNGLPGDLTIGVRNVDGEGKPTGEDLTSGVIAQNDIPTEANWFGVNVTPYELQASTQYAIVIRCPNGSVVAYVEIYYSSVNPLADGEYAYSYNSGDSWSLTATYDFRFKLSSGWSWSDIQSLDCDIELDDTAAGKIMYCAKVEIRVTYTPSAEADISNEPASENLGIVLVNTTYYAYGSAPSNPVQDGECTFTVTNNSGANVDITVEADNFTGGVGWALTSGAPGENTVKMIAYYSGQDPASGVTLTTSPQAFISALADNTSEFWDFSLTTGTFTDGAEKTSLITLAASLS